MIDPTCGSGHFLLGAFRRVFDASTAEAPGLDVRVRVQRALDAVHGVDVNPFAAAVARFRLMVAALRACGASRLDAPDAPAFSLHIAVGDALLYEQGQQGELDFEGLGSHQYAVEDLAEHPDILRPGRYHVVVGNPPYITVKDSRLNAAYRRGFTSCHRQYALSVPFAELFFRLAIQGGNDGRGAGYIGQITANSFMKREFGKKLIEDFFQSIDSEQPRVDRGEGGGFTSKEWERFYEFTGTKLAEFPVPDGAPLERARRLDALAQELAAASPATVCAEGVPTRDALEKARERWETIRAEMIAVQEELDWEIYRLYGILDDGLTYPSGELPGLALGERAFEVVLARKAAAGEADTEWFTRHRSTPVTEIPARWPEPYRDLVRRRIEAIGKHPLLHLIERPECKRRWSTRTWEDMRSDALRGWLLDRLEAEELWRDKDGSRVLSVARLADLVRGDADLRAVLDLYIGVSDYDLAREVGRLVSGEAVPYLAAWRYKPAGLRKRAVWEETWRLQRLEDAGEHTGSIPVPPKYTSADFRSGSYWRHRGKLDVPKERFVSYPGTEREGDRTAVLGWAGWDHLARARALARLVLERGQSDGWDGERLTPLLAGLAELEPWLRQWHDAPDPLYGGSPAGFFTTFLDEQCQAAGLTRAQLAAWRP